MNTREELVTTDEPAVVAGAFPGEVIVKDSQSDGRLADSTGTKKSDECEVFVSLMIPPINSSRVMSERPSAAAIH